jgi:glycosyltransferase involved in cell wall biosynthesis
MKIGIFGRHPVPQPGFNGVMSLYEAKWFSLFGHDVELLIPFKTDGEIEEFRRRHSLASFDDLDRFGGDFAVTPVVPSQESLGSFDVLVYQSYDPADWDLFALACRRSARVLTKNFPKFVSGRGYQDDPSVVNQFKTFDLVACALNDDVQDLKTCRRFFAQHAHQIAYVGRGADEELLHPARKIGPTPVVGLEAPVGDDLRAVEHYAKAIRLLRQRGLELRVLTLGKDMPAFQGERIAYGRFDRIYDTFFNEIWAYLVINYAYSPAHLQAPVQKVHPRNWQARALYEVQNVEAQMSGAALLGHQSNVISELFEPGSSGFLFPSFDAPEDIADRLESIIDNYQVIRKNARDWAVRSFRWSDCIKRWEQALLLRLN